MKQARLIPCLLLLSMAALPAAAEDIFQRSENGEPLKLIMLREVSILSEPRDNSAAVRRVNAFDIFYLAQHPADDEKTSPDFYRVATSSDADSIIGWVHARDARKWTGHVVVSIPSPVSEARAILFPSREKLEAAFDPDVAPQQTPAQAPAAGSSKVFLPVVDTFRIKVAGREAEAYQVICRCEADGAGATTAYICRVDAQGSVLLNEYVLVRYAEFDLFDSLLSFLTDAMGDAVDPARRDAAGIANRLRGFIPGQESSDAELAALPVADLLCRRTGLRPRGAAFERTLDELVALDAVELRRWSQAVTQLRERLAPRLSDTQAWFALDGSRQAPLKSRHVFVPCSDFHAKVQPDRQADSGDTPERLPEEAD